MRKPAKQSKVQFDGRELHFRIAQNQLYRDFKSESKWSLISKVTNLVVAISKCFS